MHTLRYVGTNKCGRTRNSASTLVYAEYVSIRFKHVTNTRNSTLVYVVLQRRDPKIWRMPTYCLYVRPKLDVHNG